MNLTIDQIHLAPGAHKAPGAEMCVVELSAYIAGEPHSDHPACVCPTLAAFLRSWNDSLPDEDRQKLKPYAARVIGTAGDGNAERRAWIALDWLTRTCAPAWLDLAGLTDHAGALRATPEITDRASLSSWDAAWAAARDAAWAAAWAAARDAAGDAAWAAAWAAAWDAAWAAARDAAGDAAWDAASRTLQPVVEQLQQSAFALLDRMITLPRRAA